MKLSFSLKNKEASLEADIEGLVEKGLEHKAKNTAKKTRHQIKQLFSPLTDLDKVS